MKTLFTKSILIGAGLALGVLTTVAIAVTVGTVKTWTTGETLTAADLNSTITSLKTALEAIPNWTKNGTSAVYTDGNVGIGTTGPSVKLHVETAQVDAPGLTVRNTNAAPVGQPYAAVIAAETTADDTGNHMLFRASTNLGGTRKDKFVIRADGNVGIGTTSPEANLDVFGDRPFTSTTTYGYSAYLRSTTAANIVSFINSNATMGSIGIGSDGNIFFGATPNSLGIRAENNLHLGADGMLTMTIDSGNVGIGIINPSYPLHMVSGAYVTTGGVWTNASSREYKENLEDLTAEEALAAVMALDPQKFNYKGEKGGCPRSDGAADAGIKPAPTKEAPSLPGSRRLQPAPCPPEQYVGFIAEDVPALVASNDRKGLSAMDLVAVLTKVVQEQQGQIEKQQNRIEVLEARLNRR